jgi:hypothetical protein
MPPVMSALRIREGPADRREARGLSHVPCYVFLFGGAFGVGPGRHRRAYVTTAPGG